MEDYIEEIEPLTEKLVAFECVENAWHGHHSFEGVRRAIQMNYVVNESYLKKEKSRHKISWLFKRLMSFF